MAGKLTALGIGKLSRPGKYYDGQHGLFVQVYPSGAKCWQQRFTISGRRRTLGLGGWVEAPSAPEALRRSLDLHALVDWTDDSCELVVFPRERFDSCLV